MKLCSQNRTDLFVKRQLFFKYESRSTVSAKEWSLANEAKPPNAQTGGHITTTALPRHHLYHLYPSTVCHQAFLWLIQARVTVLFSLLPHGDPAPHACFIAIAANKQSAHSLRASVGCCAPPIFAPKPSGG